VKTGERYGALVRKREGKNTMSEQVFTLFLKKIQLHVHIYTYTTGNLVQCPKSNMDFELPGYHFTKHPRLHRPSS